VDGITIITDDLAVLSTAEICRWIEPLRADRFGAIAILQAANSGEFSLLLNKYRPTKIILVGTSLIASVYGAEHLHYTIWTHNSIAGEITVLSVPTPIDIYWPHLNLALDRFEELL